MDTDTLAQSIVRAIEISEYAPSYYDKRLKLIKAVVGNVVANAPDSFDSQGFLDNVEKCLNENRIWLSIGECKQLPLAIEKGVGYHRLYHVATHGNVNARKENGVWVIEKDSCYAWLRAFPYGAYGGNG